MKELNTNELMNINAGGPIGDFLGDLFSAGSQVINTCVSGLETLANTCYNSGKKLGRYIGNW